MLDKWVHDTVRINVLFGQGHGPSQAITITIIQILVKLTIIMIIMLGIVVIPPEYRSPKETYAAAVDTVGGVTLASALASMMYRNTNLL